MNHDPTETRMRELSWRRELTGAEQAELRAWLAAHPEEAALNSLLQRLPDAPVPGNFTSRVMQDIEREAARQQRENAHAPPRWRRILLPRLAFAAVILGAGLFVYQRNVASNQASVTAGLRAVSGSENVLSVEVAENFDSIAQLGPRVQPDMELLSLMQ